MQTIAIERIFPVSPAELFAELTDHERFGELMGQKIRLIEPADSPHPNGVGALRQISLGPGVCFEETVRSYVPDQLMEYQVTRGGPVHKHWGRMEFQPHARGCLLNYRIRFEARLPFTGLLIRHALKRALCKGLDDYRATLALGK